MKVRDAPPASATERAQFVTSFLLGVPSRSFLQLPSRVIGHHGGGEPAPGELDEVPHDEVERSGILRVVRDDLRML